MESSVNARTRRGTVVSIVGIALNFVLAASKIVLGILFGLVSLVADGANNLSDCGGGTVSLVSFRIAEKPADREHPYGHQRVEYIASMIISFLVLLLAVELLRESVGRIVSGALSSGDLGIYILLGVSIAVKAGMFVLYRITAKKIDSDTLKAASVDSACDCLATLAVGVGLVLSAYGIAADGWAGLFVALFICWEGISILRDASSKLIGKAPDPALVQTIREIILSGEGVLGVHDLRVIRYGPRKYYATAHIEMHANLPATLSHERIDAIERDVKEQTGVELTAHFDPVDTEDGEAAEIESRIRAAVEGVYEGIELHDFRLVRGVKKKIIFEVGVPFDCKTKDGEIIATVGQAVKILGYEPVITVDRE